MTIEQGGAVEQKHVLVGFRLDTHSRELLNWAIVKVAEPGDRILAVNVCRDHVSESQSSLDKHLEIYEALCNAKKVVLAGQVLSEKSIRKTLVREAKKCGAAALLVGIDKRNALGGRTATAKYCAKKLPSSTDVFAVQNGKIFFRRCSNNQLTGLYRDPKPSLLKENPKETHSEFGESETDTEFSFHDHKSTAAVRGNLRILSRPSFESCCSSLEQKPGWPLLKRAIPETPKLERSNVSVVQWVMSLPDRTPYVTPPQSSTQDVESVTESIGISCSVIDEVAEQMEILLREKSADFKWFDFEVLHKSTSQFSSDNLIGKGGSNHVYKGILEDGKSVAVKVLESSEEARKDFAAEIGIISSLGHKNIITLHGICIQDGNLLSVYDFLAKGSLEQNLHGIKEKSKLSWKRRLKVAVGVAEALDHLHNSVSQPIIHRDVKSSNILLTDDYQPKLSDFGLAIWGPKESSFLTEVEVVGTFGYLAPEYFMFGKVSNKIDVYAFGVVLLELLSGRKPISSMEAGVQESLVMWAKPMIESGDVKNIMDPDLVGDVDDKEVQRMILAATLCLTRSARLRPNISQVLKLLRGEINFNISEDSVTTNPTSSKNTDYNDDEVYPNSSVASHLDVAFLDLCDDSTSFSSLEMKNSVSLEEYVKGRWSRSSSFD